MVMEPHQMKLLEDGPNKQGWRKSPCDGDSLFLLLGGVERTHKRREDAKLRNKGYFHE